MCICVCVDIDLKVASKFFGGRFACGSSVTGDDEIVIQGDVKDELFDVLTEKWPQVCLDGCVTCWSCDKFIWSFYKEIVWNLYHIARCIMSAAVLTYTTDMAEAEQVLQ